MALRLSVTALLMVVATALTGGGCTPPDNGGDNGGYDPSPGGQGIPEGTYAGTVECTETTSLVQEGQDDTVLGQTTPSFPVAFSFDDSGDLLDSNGHPVAAGSVDSTTISGQTATGAVRRIEKAIDRLEVIADATATVEVAGYGELSMIGVVTAVYGFSEPNTVILVSDKVFTSNLVDSQFIKIVAECSATLSYE
ncbi:MAG: hypothetical protein ACUVXJ_14955 [Phycisphaerae bacterium]